MAELEKLPVRLRCHAWGVVRDWVPVSNMERMRSRGYVLLGKPFAPFEERGRSRAELEDFYRLVEVLEEGESSVLSG